MLAICTLCYSRKLKVYSIKVWNIKLVLVVAHSFCVSQSIPPNVNVRVLCLAIPPAAILRSTTLLVAFVPTVSANYRYNIVVQIPPYVRNFPYRYS